MNDLSVIVLAAGKGSRMESSLPKVLHKVGDKTMIVRVIEAVKSLNPINIVVITSDENNSLIKEELDNHGYSVEYAIQKELLGTGDALRYVDTFSSINMIVNGDSPLITSELYQSIADHYAQGLMIVTTEYSNPTGYGRVIVENQKVIKIVEEKDCDDETKQVTLVNCGIYVATKEIILTSVPQLKNDNKQGEYYITDLVSINKGASYYRVSDRYQYQLYNVNTKKQLDQASLILSSSISCS